MIRFEDSPEYIQKQIPKIPFCIVSSGHGSKIIFPQIDENFY